VYFIPVYLIPVFLIPVHLIPVYLIKLILVGVLKAEMEKTLAERRELMDKQEKDMSSLREEIDRLKKESMGEEDVQNQAVAKLRQCIEVTQQPSLEFINKFVKF